MSTFTLIEKAKQIWSSEFNSDLEISNDDLMTICHRALNEELPYKDDPHNELSFLFHQLQKYFKLQRSELREKTIKNWKEALEFWKKECKPGLMDHLSRD